MDFLRSRSLSATRFSNSDPEGLVVNSIKWRCRNFSRWGLSMFAVQTDVSRSRTEAESHTRHWSSLTPRIQKPRLAQTEPVPKMAFALQRTLHRSFRPVTSGFFLDRVGFR